MFIVVIYSLAAFSFAMPAEDFYLKPIIAGLTSRVLFSWRDPAVVFLAWFNLTGFHGVSARNHGWRDFVVPVPTKKCTWPAHDEPNDSDLPPIGKQSSR